MNLSAQRNAIESLLPGLRPCVIGPDRRYFLGRREVFLLGFSVNAFCGTDTVAVFGPEPGRCRQAAPPEADRFCAGAVFLRSPAPDEETDEAAALFGPATEAEIVEAVTIGTIEPRQSVLWPTGVRTVYPVLITAYRPAAG